MSNRDGCPPACVAVLGLGDAGVLLGRDLVSAGATVRAYDPAYRTHRDALRRLPSAEHLACEAEAVEGADLVLSVNTAADAETALRNGLRLGQPGHWADLNTSWPGQKARLAGIAQDAGWGFVDMALMSPVPGRGLATPALAAGESAQLAACLLNSLGGAVEVIDGPPGSAAMRKLLRSVFFKGVAAAVVEAISAGEAAELGEWLESNIAQQLAAFDETSVQRLLQGSRLHAVRRAGEMRAAAEMLEELGVVPTLTRATAQVLGQLADGSAKRPTRTADELLPRTRAPRSQCRTPCASAATRHTTRRRDNPWSSVKAGDLAVTSQPLGFLGVNHYHTNEVRLLPCAAAQILTAPPRGLAAMTSRSSPLPF